MIKPIKSLGLIGFAMLGQAQAADLSGVKNYLLSNISQQAEGTAKLQQAANAYYRLAQEKNFDYRRVANDPRTLAIIRKARIGWKQASPAYENVEGIVAGVETLSEFDVILDAGIPGSTGMTSEDVVPFDLTLPSGRVLQKPGNLFGVTEGSLWGTESSFSSNVPFDVNKNFQIDFGEKLPDANVLKAGADMLHSETVRLQRAAQAWQPTQKDVFNALASNVPTVGPVFFEDWKSSRFILGDAATRRDFMVISRLDDLKGNIASWQAMYRGLGPGVRAKNPQLDKQITAGLSDLSAYVDRLVRRESQRRYTPEQAEQLQREAENRATAITGKITQAAALLGIDTQ